MNNDTNQFQHLVGRSCIYTSKSGREWPATIMSAQGGATPCGDLPYVNLEFRNERGKLVRRGALPITRDGRILPMTYRLEPLTPLRWSFGPTVTDPDSGKMWCADCGGLVMWLYDVKPKGGHVCCGCGRTCPEEDKQNGEDGL
jgi:hypothetical protein